MRQRRRGLALFGAAITAGWLVIALIGVAQAQELGNMVFFRGGYARMNDDRSNQVFTDVFGLSGENDSRDGWHVGAGLELLLSKNVWGLMPKTWALGEIAIEYRNFGTKAVVQVVPTAVASILAGKPVPVVKDVRIQAFTVDIAPKIKFFEGSLIRPWVIPAGLGIHVVSPPADSATVLDLGYHVGAGVEYEILHGIVAGLDVRYNVTAGHAFSGNTSDASNDFLTTGAYLGISF